MKKPDFLHVDTDSWKTEIEWKILGWAWWKNGCGHSVLRTLKLAVCQEKMNERNWFLVCWYKFMETKSYFNNFWVGGGQKWAWPLRSWNSKICCITGTSWWNELIFLCWYKFGKVKNYFNNYELGMVEKGWGFRIMGLDELSRLIEWYLYAESDGYPLKLPRFAILGWYCLA